MASEPLTAADRASLTTERGPVNMAVGAAVVFEGGAGLSYEAVRERLTARLHLIPRYRQKLVEAPLGIAGPVWADDEDFDLDWHLDHATLPSPDALPDYLGREMSRKLDRARPLWELHIVDGLADGRVALMPKMHHALVDGVAAIDVSTVILDPSPEPLDIPPPDEPWSPRPYDPGAHIARLAATPFVRAQQLAMDTALRALETSPRSAADDLRKATDLLVELARQRPQAPMTPLNEPLGPNRRYASARADLGAIKAAGKATGGTVNDVLLAAVAGMLARYLPATESEPVALVPVSVRREEERGEMGNRISMVFVDLPTDVDDPAERVQRVSAETRALKGSAAVRAGGLIAGATGWVPPAVSSLLARAMGGVRAHNIVVSNVPGPQQPFYLNGSRLLQASPAVPLNPANQRLTVGILSYDGGVSFGLLADRDLAPPVGEAAAALDASLAELLG
ncbi:MAG: wax ester/triacylglycerol synthase family O-acyltransferase [Solirubrobacteraceae bacterium]